MAIVSVDEIYGREAFITRDWLSCYKRTFQVETSGTTDGPGTVINALGIEINNTYASGSETDTHSFCSSVNCKQTARLASGFLWELEVTYEPYDITLFQRNPLDCRPEINWDFVQFDEEVDEDIDGNPISSTAGVPFNPKIKRDQSRPVLTIARNEQSYTPAGALQYIDKVNSDSFFGFDPRQVKIGNITAAELYHPVCGRFVRVNYIFHIKREGWKEKLLNAGFHQLVGGVIKPILVKGIPPSDPMLLDNAGVVAAPGADPVYLDFYVYEAISFAPLGFGDL